jgi:predicted MPP superfamily phosphohydrolase
MRVIQFCLLLLPLCSTAAAPVNPATRPISAASGLVDPTSRINSDTLIQIIYTSDIHFGITRSAFDGDSNVHSAVVNARQVSTMNALPSLPLPVDQGVSAGQKVGPVDYIMISGDIANRQEVPIQSAAASWDQFRNDYLKGITLHDHLNRPTGFLLVPGNHDVSDAIGFYRQMEPATDATSMAGIYNLMMHPATPLTAASFRYPDDKINYSRLIGGIDFLFINIWPDSANRIWMNKELARIDMHTPVIIVCHDPPDADAAHFTNPHGQHDINGKDRFENLLEERSKDARKTTFGADGKPQDDSLEQLGFVTFLKAHPNIKAYFHGHNNWNQFYTYTGPNGDISLPTFRVDSPMKGKYSSKDETKLSFQLISIDSAAKTLTVRECRWNTDPTHPDKLPVWGDSRTIQL